MSKSLKNFISIRDYFNNNPDKASLNFRIFCLQYKYHSALHLTDDRLEEANIFRIKIENFYKVIDSIVASSSLADNSFRCNKPTNESISLLNSLRLCKVKIRKAFENDFDTPEALRCLSVLMGEGTITIFIKYYNITFDYIGQQYALKYEKNGSYQPIEPLISVRDYLNSIINVFGLQFIDHTKSTSSKDNDIDHNAYIENFVRFRSRLLLISIYIKKYC